MDTRRFVELARRFTMPPRLNVARPRSVRLSAAGVAVAVFAALLFAGAGVSYVLISRESARQAANRQRLTIGGVTTEGAVARLWRDGDNRRQVEYRFEVQARSYVGRAKVSDAIRRTLQVGSPLVVRYVPTDPRLSDLRGPGRSGLPAAIAPVVAVLLVAAGGLCVYGVQRQRQLLMDGRIAPGIVTANSKSHNSHGGEHKVIEFEFQTLNGAIRRGSTASSKPPAVGSAVCILYDPDRPERHAVYPFSLVTPAT